MKGCTKVVGRSRAKVVDNERWTRSISNMGNKVVELSSFLKSGGVKVV